MATSQQEVLGRVRRFASARGEQFSATFSWFILERFMARLAGCSAREHLALQGDLMIHALTGGTPPHEWRAELQRYGHAIDACALDLLTEVCAHISQDSLRYEVKPLAVLAPHNGDVARTRLFRLTGFLGPTQCTVKLWIHETEVVSLRPVDYHFLSFIEGLDGGRVQGCPPAMVMAHLLRGLVGNGVAVGHQASYRGLQVLLSSAQITEADAVAAIRSVFSSCGTAVSERLPIALSEEIAVDVAKKQAWQAFQARARVQATPFEDTVRVLRESVGPWLRQASRDSRL